MKVRTYSPWPASGPAIVAAGIVLAAYVIGPLIARVLIALDDIHQELPNTD